MRIISRLHHKGLIGRNRKFLPIYISSLLLAFHYGLILYIESSYLEVFFSQTVTSLMFGLGALLFLILILSTDFLAKIGTRKVFFTFIYIEAISVYLMTFSKSPSLVALGFIFSEGSLGFLSYLLDIFLEKETRDEGTTGEVRGIYLTMANAALVVAPITTGLLLQDNNYERVFLISLFVLIPLIFLHFSSRLEKHYIPRIHSLLPKSLRLGIFLSFLLQFFYGWMVAWSPIYLHQIVGLNWQEIGIVFSIMLLPFALFELPLGELQDSMFGEKEIMAIGFFIAGIATTFISLVTGASLIMWALVLFVTRTGASAIEISTESFFFKHVSGGDKGVIGVFRLVKPVALMLGPVIGSLCIGIFGFQQSFTALGAILIWGAFLAMRIKDTL